jgi:hypothetical protein
MQHCFPTEKELDRLEKNLEFYKHMKRKGYLDKSGRFDYGKRIELLDEEAKKCKDSDEPIDYDNKGKKYSRKIDVVLEVIENVEKGYFPWKYGKGSSKGPAKKTGRKKLRTGELDII